jgi:hypothetical protein
LTAVAAKDHQGRPFELVELGDDVGCFPGVPDQDGVDRAMAGWAMRHDQVQAVTRCWAQPRDDDTQRIRVYGVLVDAPDAVGPAREESAEVVRAASGGRVAIEVIVPADDPPQRQRRVLGQSVLLWELADPTE